MRFGIKPVLLIILIGFIAAFAQDWPQYLGPERNSTSPQKNILRTWAETGPEVLWSVAIGKGYGGAVAKDGKAYLNYFQHYVYVSNPFAYCNFCNRKEYYTTSCYHKKEGVIGTYK